MPQLVDDLPEVDVEHPIDEASCRSCRRLRVVEVLESPLPLTNQAA